MIIFYILSLLAEILGTVGGFGSSVFFVPIATFYFDYHKALGLTALFHLASNISKIALFRKGLDKKLLINLGIPAVLFVIFGSFLTKYIESIFLEIALGITLILTSLIFLIFKNLEINPRKKETIIGGSLSGFFAGFLGTGGAIRGITMAAFNLPKNVFVATSAAIDFSVDFSRTIVYLYNGYITYDLIGFIPYLLIIGFAGTYIGKFLLNKLPQSKFRVLSLVLILLIGIAALVSIYFK